MFPCRLFALCVAALLGAASLTGCSGGPEVGDVAGRVTFKNQPVEEGTITFFDPETGSVAEAPLERDGRYEIKRLVVGEYIVQVNPAVVIDNSDPRTPPSPVEKAAPNIPQKYRSQGGTPLRAKIEKGTNQHDFDMTP